MSLAGHLLVFVMLTLVSQIGGLCYLVAVAVSRFIPRQADFGRRARVVVGAAAFFITYAAVSMYIVPPVAAVAGRYPLPCEIEAEARVVPLNRLVCILNRHYAKKPVHDMLMRVAAHLETTYPGTLVAYLDAGFPLLDGFPLLPHLSHGDGLKVDLAFFYHDISGPYMPRRTPSPIGYWGFEHPRPGEPRPCLGRSDLLTLRWDMAFLEQFTLPMRFDADRTGEMLMWLSSKAEDLRIEKILLEPHLSQRFNLNRTVVRFQGCRAARHDDHVHIALKRVH